MRKLKQLPEREPPVELADVGCASGELLYLIARTFPDWELYGYDREAAFVEAAREMPGLRDVELRVRDLFDLSRRFDVVTCTLVLPLYRDGVEPLRKLIELTRPGGWLLATGLFNRFPVDVRVEYRDHSRGPDAEWMTDYNRHSRRLLRESFEDEVRSIAFERCPFGVDLERDPERPTRVWTLRDEDGQRIIVNGAGQILNQTLMTVRV